MDSASGDGHPGPRIAVLGPVQAHLDDLEVDLGTPKQRALVAALALAQGQPVSVDTIVDVLWGDAPPPGATATLQAYVSGLRKVLEPHRQRRAQASVLVTVAPGYALRLPPPASDAGQFEQAVTEEHRRLAVPLLGPSPLPADVLQASADRLGEALALWRGRPYAELEDVPAAVAERAHLDELRLVAMEDRAVARLALGDQATTAAELESLTTAHPLRERLWALRALALVRSGRQADALDVLRQVREVLADELGLDPGAELRSLQEQVLRQDPELAWRPPVNGEAAGSPVGASPSPPSGADDPTRSPAWPMLGRDEELVLLERSLARAVGGRASFAVITGDPGIGKSRLCAELVAYAHARGARVAVGRCSQDDGAPPLWPWTTALEQLGGGLLPGSAGETDVGADFRFWEQITRAIREVAEQHPLVLVLDDLHWADTATLRVLRLLAETAAHERLLVVTTWRDRPRPTGALGEVAEALARRHADRLELAGLDESAVAGLVGAVTRLRPTDEQANALLRRTGGNPFFLVEYSRLVGERTDLEAVLGGSDPPTAIQEVLGRRLEQLPEGTLTALRTASVIGRAFDVPVLAGATATDDDELLDLLEPAVTTGLVREDGVDRFVFDHALVRDTVYNALSPTRRARQHARVAGLLEGWPGRETELARHWLASGPAHAAQAWRAAVTAAEVAVRAHAYPEAAELYQAALGAQGDDPQAGPRDRYDVLMALATANRWAARWPELTDAVEEAVKEAEAIGEPVLAAEAAISTTLGALWQSAHHGQVHAPIVAALRRSLDALPDEDSDLRCRCMISLANELYYAPAAAERASLTEEAFAMARRLADPALLLHVCLAGFVTIWSPANATERLALAEEALVLARQLGDEMAEAMAGVMHAMVLGELGLPDRMWEAYAEHRERAEKLRLVYSLLVLDNQVLPWLCLAGRFGEAERMLHNVIELASVSTLRHADDAIRGNLVTLAMWRSELDIGEEMLAELASSPFPMTATVAFVLWRTGQEERAVRYLAEHEVDLADEDWFSMLNWCYAGAMAAYAGDAPLAAEAYRLMAPYAGRSCSAGSGVASGPVDAYLALAAHAVGERDLAIEHADEAERLAGAWRIPVFAAWLREQRQRFGF